MDGQPQHGHSQGTHQCRYISPLHLLVTTFALFRSVLRYRQRERGSRLPDCLSTVRPCPAIGHGLSTRESDQIRLKPCSRNHCPSEGPLGSITIMSISDRLGRPPFAVHVETQARRRGRDAVRTSPIAAADATVPAERRRRHGSPVRRRPVDAAADRLHRLPSRQRPRPVCADDDRAEHARVGRGTHPDFARRRRWNGKVWFGVNLVPDGRGTISVGDAVAVLT